MHMYTFIYRIPGCSPPFKEPLFSARLQRSQEALPDLAVDAGNEAIEAAVRRGLAVDASKHGPHIGKLGMVEPWAYHITKGRGVISQREKIVILQRGIRSFFNAPGVISQRTRAVTSCLNFVRAAAAFILQRAMVLTFCSPSFWVCWFLGLLVSGSLGFWVSWFLGFWVSWFLGFLVFRSVCVASFPEVLGWGC